MVSYYHSTIKSTKNKIINDQKVIFSNFSIDRYVNHLLNTITIKDTLESIPSSYIGAPRQAPFMGNGLYCFESKIEACEHQSETNHDVVVVNMKNNISVYDMDDKKTKFEILNILNQQLQIFVDSRDAEDKIGWEALVELLKQSLYTDFERSPEMVGVMIYILREISPRDLYDVYLKKFYVTIKSKSMRYVLIKNKVAILNLA